MPLCPTCCDHSQVGASAHSITTDSGSFHYIGLYHRSSPETWRALSPLGSAIVAFKDRGDRYSGRCLARLFASAFAPLIGNCDVIVPIPSDRERLRARGFSPALWLATALGRQARKPVRPSALGRSPGHPSQRGLDGAMRRHNARGAATLGAIDVRGYGVVLVDDVVTTGATLHDAAHCLQGAGARVVLCAALACADREGLSSCRSRTEPAGNSDTAAPMR